MIAFFIFLGVIALSSIVVGLYITFRCKHQWRLIEQGRLYYSDSTTKRQIGIYKFYECIHCKKLREEKLSVE